MDPLQYWRLRQQLARVDRSQTIHWAVEKAERGEITESALKDILGKSDGEGRLPQHDASRSDSLSVLASIICTRLTDIDAPTNAGTTALHLAAYNGHFEKVEFLLAAGASQAPQDSSGQSALDHAREQNHTRIVKLLQMNA